MRHWLAKIAVTITFAFGAAGASAQQCVGFGDVLQSSAFCPGVEWLKNRAITTGCAGGANYCPNDAVSRLAMAAFMQRLGKALTPEVLTAQIGWGPEAIPGESPDLAMIHCVTAISAATVHPRQAIVAGIVSGLADANAAAFRAFLLVRANGGSYTNLDASSVASRTTLPPGSWGVASVTEQMNLDPGTTYQFAIGIRRDNLGATTTGNFALARCQITASIFNRNPATPPL